MQAETHKGYLLAMRGGACKIYDKRYPKDAAVYCTWTIDDGKKWVDAYIEGAQWAVEARTYWAEGREVLAVTGA